MKVRWTKNSVRLRITPEELAQLQSYQTVAEWFRLPGTRGWSVRIAPSATTSLSMYDGVLVLSMTPDEVAQLSEPEREGVYFSQDDIRYYIEKDFPCAHPRASEADEALTTTFTPPSGFEERKNS